MLKLCGRQASWPTMSWNDDNSTLADLARAAGLLRPKSQSLAKPAAAPKAKAKGKAKDKSQAKAKARGSVAAAAPSAAPACSSRVHIDDRRSIKHVMYVVRLTSLF